MCGIAGIVKYNNQKAEEARLLQMMQRMKYRGPNDEGIFIADGVGLGHVRLSILDLSPAGHQPMENERYALVLNGEVYNYVELREELIVLGHTFHTQTDTEVLLEAYTEWGVNCLDRLNGMFAFAVYDKLTKDVVIVRDRFGVKPLYYYEGKDELIFASEIPPILEVYGQKNTANDQAVFDYLVFNRTDHTEETFFRGIKKLQHGCYMRVEEAKCTVHKWYNLAERVAAATIKSNTETYIKELDSAVEMRLRSDVPVGVCLSGGLDSSTIASLLVKHFGKEDISTFSAVYGKENNADESRFIELYKDHLRNMYYTVPTADTLLEDMDDFIRSHAEPLPSTGPYAQYRVMKLAKEHVTVILDGQGADEELAGYHYFYGLYYKSLLKKFRVGTLLKEMVLYIQLHKSLYALKTFLFFLLPSRMRTKARLQERAYVNREFAKKHKDSVIADSLYGSQTMQEALVNHFEYKLEHLLKWNDRNSMAFSIESRTPFLDYRLVEYTLRTEDSAKIKNGYTKSILREAMKGILPEPIRLRRDKKGFSTPQDEWFREDRFQKLVRETLDSKICRERGYIDVDAALALYDKHIRKEINIAKDIWKWVNLELWFRMFID